MSQPMIRPSDAPAVSEDPRKPRRLWRSREERAADKAAARTRAALEAIEEQRAVDQRELERLEAQREIAKVRDELDQHAQGKQQHAAKQRRTLRQRISRAVVLASANVGVNAVAVLGQVLALTLGLDWPWWAAVPLALVVESVAVNVGYIAHDKLINGYSAGWLRLLSYAIGAGVGWFNYSHNADQTATGDFAGVFGACSLLSPVLWQIYSQWRHWQELRDRNLLDVQAPKFSRARWIFWARETFFIFRRAVRHGVSDRAEAVRRFQPEYEHRGGRRRRRASKPLPPAADALAEALAQWSEDYRQRGPELDANGDHLDAPVATGPPTGNGHPGALAEPSPEGRSWLKRMASWSRPDAADSGDRNGDQQPVAERVAESVADIEPFDGVDATDTRPVADRKRPDEQDRKTAVRFYMTRARKLNPPSKRTLAEWSGFGETWALDRIREGQQQMAAQGWSFDERGTPTPPSAVADPVAATNPEHEGTSA